MFGVLVVRTPEGTTGYLVAFSGNLAGSNCHEFFVPPVYDLLNPEDYFKEEEERISCINKKISDIEKRFYTPQQFKDYLTSIQAETDNEINEYRLVMKASQEKRNELRKQGNLSEDDWEKLNKQSQFEKAELKRIKTRRQAYLDSIMNQAKPWLDEIQQLKEERKSRSFALQQWTFRQFRMLNAHKEEKDLCEIFQNTQQVIPPAGAGECAAPKLLQYAYLKGLEPIAMAEFWWGDSPKGEIRRHGHYYPACKHKCEPILNFMLKGLTVEPNPLLTSNTNADLLETMYEDEYLIVVNKPAGMLSVSGKNGQDSVSSILKSAIHKLQVRCWCTD